MEITPQHAKRSLEKRLERLEADREANRLPAAAEYGWTGDEEEYERLMRYERERSPDTPPSEITFGLTTVFAMVAEKRELEDDPTK